MNEEIIYAMIDGDGIVRNTIVVNNDWNLGGVPIGDYAVGIGDVYNFTDKKFYHADGTPCKTRSEIQAEFEAEKQRLRDITKVVDTLETVEDLKSVYCS